MKFYNVAKRYGAVIGAGAGALVLSGSAHATSAYSAITSAAVWTDAAADVVLVFAALAVVLVALKGGRMVLRAIGR